MPCKLDSSQTLVLSGGFVDHERVIALSKDSVKELYDLCSSQEEADTRLLGLLIQMFLSWESTSQVNLISTFGSRLGPSNRLATFPCTA